MDHVYVVVGQTGEHDDKREWNVCAYLSEESAGDHRDKANRWARENKLDETLRQNRPVRYGGLGNPWDADMVVDYTGTSYRVRLVELRGSVA